MVPHAEAGCCRSKVCVATICASGAHRGAAGRNLGRTEKRGWVMSHDVNSAVVHEKYVQESNFWCYFTTLQ